MDVHLRDLRYFVTVADELYFTRAAELLHVSQPSLSKQVRLLERQLGFALFTRDRRSVSLTPGGRALLEPAHELLRSWDETIAAATRLARDAAGVIHVGFHTSVAGGVYRDTITVFGREHPRWTVELQLYPWSDATAGLLAGSSDVAFVWLPVPDQELLGCRVLRTEPRCVAVWQTHPLASRPEVRMADLLDEPFVALPPTAGVLRDYWLAVEDRDQHPIRIGAHAESPDAAFEAVASAQGVALLSAGNAELYARPGIVSIPVTDLARAQIAIAWRADDSRTIIREFTRAAENATAHRSHAEQPVGPP
jgi:DNA-binding transcriptional LysR family regulator